MRYAVCVKTLEEKPAILCYIVDASDMMEAGSKAEKHAEEKHKTEFVAVAIRRTDISDVK